MFSKRSLTCNLFTLEHSDAERLTVSAYAHSNNRRRTEDEPGADSRNAAQAENYDIIVLDVMLPRMDGWVVLRALRASKATPGEVLSHTRSRRMCRII
jgi:DNA-binding response OmpR family regulator